MSHVKFKGLKPNGVQQSDLCGIHSRKTFQTDPHISLTYNTFTHKIRNRKPLLPQSKNKQIIRKSHIPNKKRNFANLFLQSINER